MHATGEVEEEVLYVRRRCPRSVWSSLPSERGHFHARLLETPVAHHELDLECCGRRIPPPVDHQTHRSGPPCGRDGSVAGELFRSRERASPGFPELDDVSSRKSLSRREGSSSGLGRCGSDQVSICPWQRTGRVEAHDSESHSRDSSWHPERSGSMVVTRE